MINGIKWQGNFPNKFISIWNKNYITCSGSSLMSKTEDHKMENVQVGIILKEIQNQ